MTQRPALLLASAALLVSAVGGGLALHEARQARQAAAPAIAHPAVDPRYDTLAAELATQRRATEVATAEAQALREALQGLRAETAQAREAAVADLQRRLAALEAAPVQPGSEGQEGFAARVAGQVGQLRAQVEELRAQAPQAAAAALEGARARILQPIADEISGQVAALRAQVEALRAASPETTATLEGLRAQVEALRQSAASAQTLEGLSRLLEDARGQIAALNASAPQTQAAIATLQQRIQALESVPVPTPTLERLLAEAPPEVRQALGQLGLAATVANPQQVMEAITAFVQEQRRIEAQGRPVAPALLTETFAPDSGALRAGPPGAARRVAIMTDHNCPFCRRAVPLVRQLIAQGDVEIVIHEMPILSPQSREAALVAAAAARMDPRRALELYLAVGAHEGRLDGNAMIEKAAGLGFDREALRRETGREETARTVDRSLDLARRLGISGTPGFVAQDLLIQGLQPEQVLQAINRPR